VTIPEAASAAETLLRVDDPPPFVRRQYGRRLPVVIACDHASARIPAALADLGLGPAQRARHIAWDIGAGALAAALARRLGVAMVAGGYSRLVIDCNRRLDDPTSIVEVSDGDRVPGNVGLGAAARGARAREIFAPYHAALAAELAAAAGPGVVPALVAIHSFTDVFGGRARPWHCGILWDRDPRLALPLLAALRREPGLVVGDNEPYSGRHPADFTVDHHGERHGRPHVCIEVRQDLLADDAGIEAWGERLARHLAPLLSDPQLYRTARVATASAGADCSGAARNGSRT
jgi:predicted N-formylglutamate amidohydrolase